MGSLSLAIELAVSALVFSVLFYVITKSWSKRAFMNPKPQNVQKKVQKPMIQSKSENITWDLIGGYDDVKKEIKEYIEIPLKYKDVAKKYSLRLPKGILLFGPPGCGKTLMMRAMANSAKLNFVYVNVSEIMSKWYGESESRLRELFSTARKNAPCILFFDEIDTIGTKRENHTGDSVTPRLLSLMLSEIDGMESEEGVIIVGSTNVPQLLDKALLRAGRFDKLIYLGPPSKSARRDILKVHCSGMPLAEDVSFDTLAEITERYSGADLANICQEVARKVASESLEKGVERKITMSDFQSIIKNYKPSISLSMVEDYEKFRLDYERRGKQEQMEDKSEITIDDIGGYQQVKEELLEILEMQLKYSKMMEEMKISPVRGILLYGPPGVGKTMMAKALARTLNVKLIPLSGAEVMYKGYEGAISVIKEVFNRARENKPSIVLLDEIDAIASRRNKESSASKIVNQILTEMDGIRSLTDVVVVATTNRIRMVDTALLRPGRFDKIIHMPLPNSFERDDIFSKYLGIDVCKSVDCRTLAEMTEGYSGADIAAITREAKIKVLKERIKGNSSRNLTQEDLIEAINKIKPSIKKRLKNAKNSRSNS
ncbi:ATPase AAA [Sulfolobales archaeon HS-7]|nr:ATPase AAA [Sulfolobales archaeon HS-7]